MRKIEIDENKFNELHKKLKKKKITRKEMAQVLGICTKTLKHRLDSLNNKKIMKTKMMVYEDETYGSLRIFVINNERWYASNDASRVLGYAKSGTAANLTNDKGKRTILKSQIDQLDCPNDFLKIPNRGLTIICEEAFFRLTSSRNKELEERLRQWLSEADNDVEIIDFSDEIKVFENKEFGSVRVFEIDGEPWFMGGEVAKSLGYFNTRDAIKSHVEEEDKINTVVKRDGNKKGNPNQIIINESGLYSLIMSSKLPTAKKFKRWITTEVLPSIRKHGAYMTQEKLQEALYNPDFLIQLANNLKNEQEKNKKLESENRVLESKNHTLTTSLSEERELNNSLNVRNKALLGEIKTWDYKSMVNALIRHYAMLACDKNFVYAWNSYYKQLKYKYGISLKQRRSKPRDKYIDLIKPHEEKYAIKIAAALCEGAGLDIVKIIGETNAEMIRSEG